MEKESQRSAWVEFWSWRSEESPQKVVVGESGEESTLSRAAHPKNYFVAMVP